LLAVVVMAPALVRAEETAAAASVDFNTQIRPIFTQYCSACHGGVKQAADVSFVYASQVLPPDGWIVEPGDPDASLLIERIKSTDPELQMPPPQDHPEPLPAEKIAVLERWIAEGARWGDHWSLAPLAQARPSAADLVGADAGQQDWARQPLDGLVHARLSGAQLAPSPEADPLQWLRRAAFDLTGLPPSVEQTETFLQDCNAAANQRERDVLYAEQVDRLLASERFGERWASVWMDLARYADSKGFEKDPHRDMWPYRDWLIRAFNSDLPYDEFTIKQLAGDLLDEPTADDLIATAFHRNTQTNTEGGTDDEEFRVAAVIDRVNTTWTVWQATTFGCVQCHSHPYDPLKQLEYYACLALFNNTQDSDLDSDFPTLKIPAADAQREAAVAAQRNREQLRAARNRLGSELAGQVEWLALRPRSATASDGRLRIDDDRVLSGGGTFPVGVTYTVETEAVPLTALRIEILPESDDPAKWPEQGSVLSHVKLSLVTADGTTQAIELADAFADAVRGGDDPRACLDEKNSQGVGGYPKLHQPRWAVIVLKDRLQLAGDATLRFEMLQSASVTGNLATPLRHFRWSACDDEAWTELLKSPALARLTESLAEAERACDAIQGANLPVLLPCDERVARPTRSFIRGNWLDRGEPVSPGIPAIFARRDDGEMIQVRDRLQLARWLVSEQNPLAARVWANRIWTQLFGVGLVETLEDFGSSGLPPAHPELLDHLAARLRDVHLWRLKPMLRELVLSATYRQTHHASAALRARDPRNDWLARGPRARLSAEMVRDQALAVSGLLSDVIGGPAVMPPQPEGVWQTEYSSATWDTAQGTQRYRRGLYTYWRRTSPYPSFLMFDSPTRDLCSARRIATNTPLQALVTLNDPVYVECAEALAQRAARSVTAESNAAGPSSLIAWMFQAVTQQRPTPLEADELLSLYTDLAIDQAAGGGADAALADLDPAALAIVASTIMNLDKALNK
jgi:hypothetical protein